MRQVVAFTLLLAGALLAVAGTPRAGTPVAVAVSPSSGREVAARVVAQAGGHLVRPSRFHWIVVAHRAEGAAAQGDFVAALYAAGATFVFDPHVAGGCL
jgi:hypothetical protein